MIEYSQYNQRKDLKVTYILGAGASYNSVPIWNEQSASMSQIANKIENAIDNPSVIFLKEFLDSEKYQGFSSSEINYLRELISSLKYFALKADNNDTIDSYAYILFKRNNIDELNRLKKCLSIYLDIWQFFEKNMPFRKKEPQFFYKKQEIDKRYIKWLNIITESDDFSEIKINDNINILTWNYDLQTELAFNNIYQDLNLNCLDKLNERFKFIKSSNDLNSKLSIYHLNGHHGYFQFEKKFYSTGRNILKSDFYTYLKSLFDNLSQFKIRSESNHDYGKIKFSWENKLPTEILEIAKNTDILVIIGYSFPQYNRIIDREILDAVKSNKPLYIYYQDPSKDFDKIKNIINFNSFHHDNSTSDFFVPDEFINPKDFKISF